MKAKGLNISYNSSYNRKRADYSEHLLSRVSKRNLDLWKVDETLRTGSIIKSRANKLCLSRYFGKDNETYVVIIQVRKQSIRVKTAWKRKGN